MVGELNKTRGYSCIGLNNPKIDHNVGSILRLAGNYGVKFVAISGKRYNKQSTDTMKLYRHVPIFHNLESLQQMSLYNCIPIGVDLIENAIPLPKFVHPQRAFYIFGAEDQTLDKSILDWCKDIIYVPTNRCMNLAITVSIILYDRMSKEFKY